MPWWNWEVIQKKKSKDYSTPIVLVLIGTLTIWHEHAFIRWATKLFLWITSQFHHGILEPPTKTNLCHCQFVLMSLNIHFFLGPLPIATPSHWLFVSCSRLSPSTGLCRTRHPPTIVDYHDTPAVTGGLHPLLDIAPNIFAPSNSF